MTEMEFVIQKKLNPTGNDLIHYLLLIKKKQSSFTRYLFLI